MFNYLRAMRNAHQNYNREENVELANRMACCARQILNTCGDELHGVCCSWSWVGSTQKAAAFTPESLLEAMDAVAAKAIAIRNNPDDAVYEDDSLLCKIVAVDDPLVVEHRTFALVPPPIPSVPDMRVPSAYADDAHFCVVSYCDAAGVPVCEYGSVAVAANVAAADVDRGASGGGVSIK